MSDSRTSNLRVFPMRFGMADSSYTVEYMLASEVRAEIERLTADGNEIARLYEDALRRKATAENECDRLQQELDQCRKMLSKE